MSSAPAQVTAVHVTETRWGGDAPKVWTRQRSENVRAASKYKKLKRDGALPSVYDCMLRERFVELVKKGTVYPYPLNQRRREFVDAPAGVKWKLRERHTIALGLIVAAHLSCKTQGLIITHAEMAGLLARYLGACSEKWAGVTMRELASMNLIEVVPWFSDGAISLRQASLYRVSAFAVAFFDIGPRRAKRKPAGLERECQAERTPPKGGDPECVESPVEDAGDIVSAGRVPSVPDATTDDTRTAKGVKNRPDASTAPTEPGRANGRTDTLSARVQAHVERRLARGEAQLRAAAMQLRDAQHRVERRERYETSVGPQPPTLAASDVAELNELVARGRITLDEWAARVTGRRGDA